MALTLRDLETHFRIKREEASLLFAFLTLLQPGTEFQFPNGKIFKTTEDTIVLRIDDSTYHSIANDYLTAEVDNYQDLFGNQIVEEDEADG